MAARAAAGIARTHRRRALQAASDAAIEDLEAAVPGCRHRRIRTRPPAARVARRTVDLCRATRRRCAADRSRWTARAAGVVGGCGAACLTRTAKRAAKRTANVKRNVET